MKKILSLVVAIILLSQSCVFASELPFFDKDYLSYEEEVTYSMTLNRDIKVLLGKYDLFNEGKLFFDFYKMFEGIFGTTSNLLGKANISSDYKSGKIYAGGTSIIPIYFNKNLSLTANANTDVWMEYDFSDVENPKFQMVQNTPIYDKYVIYSLSDMFSAIGNEEEQKEATRIFSQVMSNILDKETMEIYKKSYVDLLLKYAKITKSGKNYTVKLDDAGFKNLINEAVISLTNYVKNEAVSNNYITSEEFDIQYNKIAPALNAVLDYARNIQILGKDGISMTVKCDSRGYMKVSDVSVNICINVFEFLAKENPLTQELIDNGTLNLEDGLFDVTLNMRTEVTKLSNVKVDFPTLTEENSFSAFDNLNRVPEYDEYPADVEECYHYEYGYLLHQGLPVIKDGKLYPHLRDTALAIGFADCDILYDNGKVTISRPDWVKCGNYTSASFDIGGNVVYLDEVPYTISDPAFEVDDSVVISNEIAKLIFRTDETFSNDVSINFTEPCYYIWFDYKICDCDIEALDY